MKNTSQPDKTIAVLSWRSNDGICEMLCHELEQLNYLAVPVGYGAPIPPAARMLLSFGPYGQLLPVWRRVADLPASQRPVVVHWNTEGMPDPRLPGPALRLLGGLTSRLGLLAQAAPEQPGGPRWLRALSRGAGAPRLDRFRYQGDYAYAFRRGWLHVLADTSLVYARRRTRLGVPTLYVPWGAIAWWWADLKLKRDIDVLWMGTRGSARRSSLLDRVRDELQPHGLSLHVADNVENPFIFNAERTRYLNRAKITLNLTRTWYDDNFSRFAMAASNRSLIVSEPMVPHCPAFEAGKHYVSASIDRLAGTILHYLRHDNERQQIVDQAHQLVTTRLDFRNALQRLVEEALGCAPAGRAGQSKGDAKRVWPVQPEQPDDRQPNRQRTVPTDGRS